MLVNFELERLDDEFLKLTVPDEILKTAIDLNAWKEYYNTFFKNSSPKWIPSEMMGLEKLIGTIEIGKRADLIVVRDDPLKDLSALKSLLWTIKDGEARTPEEWMAKTA